MTHLLSRMATLCVVLLISSMSMAQTGARLRSYPAFEVASLKPTGPKETIIGMFVWPGGRITATNYTLKMFVIEAYSEGYRLQDFQIVGLPKWADQERYSLTATPPADLQSSKINPSNPKLPPPEEELLMLRTLLADRFALKLHEEMKEGAVYELVIGDKPRKFNDAKDKDAFSTVMAGLTGIPDRPSFVQGVNASMSRFAERLSGFLGRPVFDRTGLSGTFDFKFEFVLDINSVGTGPSLSTAIQDLGLKLVPARAPIRYLVIDRAEKAQEN